MPAGISALISGLQPLLTAVLSFPLLGERVCPVQWLGIGLGFLGAVLVLLPKLGVAEGFPPVPAVVCLVAVIGITLGTIWQKRTGTHADRNYSPPHRWEKFNLISHMAERWDF